MKIKLKGLFFVVAFTIISIYGYGQCADETNIYSFTYNGNTYEIVKENQSWTNASSCAVERGGFLAEINDISEQNAIFSELNTNASIVVSNTIAPDGGGASYVWIGGNDLNTEGNWLWDGDNDNIGEQFWLGNFSGSSIGGLYTNWGSSGYGSEPDDYGAGQDGLGLAITDWPLGNSGQWNDISHSNSLYYVIEYSSTSFIISTDVNLAEAGTVSGSGTYNENETVELTANANDGYNFVNWTENGVEVSTDLVYSFTVSENRTLIANFEIQTFEILVNVNPIVGGTATGAGTYNYLETVEVTAVTNDGYDFVNWTENEIEISTDLLYSFEVTEERTLTANFETSIGILELMNDKNYTLFPNPTNDLININFDISIDKNIIVNIVDINGKTEKLDIMKIEKNLIQVNVEDYKTGIYHLQIITDNNLLKTFKIIIND